MALSADYPRFTLGSALTAEQRAFFAKYGFLHFRPFATPEHVRQILQATQEVQAHWIAEGVEKVNGVPIKYGHDVDGSRRRYWPARALALDCSIDRPATGHGLEQCGA